MKETDEPIWKYEIGHRLAVYALFAFPGILLMFTFAAGGK